MARVGAPPPPASAPAPDRAPDELAAGTPKPLRRDLERLLGADRVLHRAIDLVRYASDASPYRLFPRVVVTARDGEDVAKVLAYARKAGLPVTFRAGGTSLNGQAQGDGIMVDARRHFAGVVVEEDGALARVRPGTVLGHVNRLLAPSGTRLGPDPASTDIATVGGVVANNSGGMRCGVTRDSYSTVRALKLVLASGTEVDTGAPGAEERFAAAEPALARGLAEIRDEIRADEALAKRIREKFRIKNTTGYRLCAFLDAETPLEIFRRLVIGSEGTLAFVAEALFETVPVPPKTTVSWLHFAGIHEAIAPVGELVACGASAVELMVAPALILASHSIPGTPEAWRELPPESAALLVEFGGEGDEELDEAEARAAEVLAGHELLSPIAFTRERPQIELDWRVREGLHGLVGRLRPEGTNLIIEDVCVAPERIADAARDIQGVLAQHGFLTGVAGHASAGNLHFMLTPTLAEEPERERYEAFMNDLVELVLEKYDGSLKAEHGTGINMAPFVEREWGERATELMWRVKALADPDGLLAPGVVLNRDPGVHLQNLKSTPPVEESVTACVECGFCEPVCPSRHLTTTPRERIVVRREMARQEPGSPVQRALLDQYGYDAIDTCAADGTCGLACPLGIDTGKLTKDLRAATQGTAAARAGVATARRWAAVERAARGALRTGRGVSRLTGDGPLRLLSGAARTLLDDELVPAWTEGMPPAAPAELPQTSREGAAAVYFPACINRIFGRAREGARRSLPEAMVAVSARAGAPLWIPPDVEGACCGTPWSSKGLRDGHAEMANRTLERAWRWSEEGELPLVVDAASCTLGLSREVAEVLSEENRERHGRLEVIDSTTWLRERVLPGLTLRRRVASAALHPPCGARHLGVAGDLEAVAGALAEDVWVPPSAMCCGFAGDRGFLHPELPEAAIRPQAEELADRHFDAYLSCNRTCEVGLSREIGAPYESVVYLVDELSATG